VIEVESRQASEVRSDIGLCSDDFTETYELIGSELVRLIFRRSIGRLLEKGLVGPEVRPARSLRSGADSVAPVVAIREASSWPSHDRDIEFHEAISKVPSNAANVRHLGIFTNPYSVVDDPAYVLDEVAMEFRINYPNWLLDQNFHLIINRFGCSRGKTDRSYGHAFFKKIPPIRGSPLFT
jgi:hypothetical protein